MIRAFELAIGQLGDPKLRSLIWWSLLLSLVLQVAIAALGIWGLRSLATFETRWINETIVWLSGTGVVVLAVMLFPASFGGAPVKFNPAWAPGGAIRMGEAMA